MMPHVHFIYVCVAVVSMIGQALLLKTNSSNLSEYIIRKRKALDIQLIYPCVWLMVNIYGRYVHSPQCIPTTSAAE